MREVVEHAVDDFGSVDICVATAGVVSFGEVCELDDEQWTTMIAINLTGVFHTLRAAASVMREQGRGRVITIWTT